MWDLLWVDFISSLINTNEAYIGLILILVGINLCYG